MDFKKYATELSVSVHVGSLHLLQSLPLTQSLPAEGEVQVKGEDRDGHSGVECGGGNDVDVDANSSGTSEVPSAPIPSPLISPLSVSSSSVSCPLVPSSSVPSPLSPSVCVLIPVRNGERYLSHCLTSLLTQPQGCLFEILLVNDGSSDRTCVIAEQYQKNVLLGMYIKNPGE